MVPSAHTVVVYVVVEGHTWPIKGRILAKKRSIRVWLGIFVILLYPLIFSRLRLKFCEFRGLNCNDGQFCTRHRSIVMIWYGPSYPAKIDKSPIKIWKVSDI